MTKRLSLMRKRIGKLGGIRRAEVLSKKRRKEIATKAILARWSKAKKNGKQ